MTLLGAGLLVLVFDLGFVAGCCWSARRPLLPPPSPDVPQFRRVARPCVVVRVEQPDTDFIAIAADYIAPREAFDPSARAVLDPLVRLDERIRGK